MSESVEEQIGSHIARLRKEREITQEQLAELVNMAPETISRIERGASVPSLKTLEKISEALHTSLKMLFDFKYRQETTSAIEKESMKLLAYLKAKKAGDIKMGHRILKGIFDQIEENYRHRK